LPKRALLFTALSALLLAGCGAADSGSGNADKTAAAAESSEEAAGKATAEKKAAEEVAAAAMKPIILKGSGTDVVKFSKPDAWDMMVATVEHTGVSNFSVHNLDKNLEQIELLVNEIGNYKGSVLLDDTFGHEARGGSKTSALEVTADGAWKITLKSVDMLKAQDGSKPIRGTNGSVIRFSGEMEVLDIEHEAEGHFSVIQHKGGEFELLVNEVGNWSGSKVVRGPSIVEVTAEGRWSLTREK
jgi:hypothetical protein